MSRRIQFLGQFESAAVTDVYATKALGLQAAALKVLGVACAVALGGFLVGFDATVISGAVPFLRDYFALGGDSGSLKLGWAVSCLGYGAMAGNLAAGML